MRRVIAAAVFGWMLLVGSAFAAQVPVPPLAARVTDQTGTLDAATVQVLNETLATFEKRKGSQIAVLIVPTTGDETIEQYSIRVTDQWKLGRKGVDDGALLLVAKDDRKVRIEVGRGLEGVIPDAIANRIIDEEIVPRFKQGDFAGGIQEAINRMMGLVDGESLPPPQPQRDFEHPPHKGNAPIIAAFWVFLFLRLLLRKFAALLRATLIGCAGGAVMFLFGVGVPFSIAIAVLMFFLGLPAGTGGRWSGGSGWGGFGGGGFGGGSSGGFGGGGFSGGGGGFGGGGASGGW